MRICPKCGFEIDNDGFLFCVKCGAKLSAIRVSEAFGNVPERSHETRIHYFHEDLLKHIDKVCKRCGEERNYVQDILSMERCESIEGLISIFNDVFELLAFDFYDGKDFPNNWYQHEYWGILFTKHVQELYCCLNDNILSWFRRIENPSVEQCTACIVNLRECDNKETVQNSILRKTNENVLSDIKNLILLRNRHYWLRRGIDQATKNSSRYHTLRNHFMDLSMILAANGHIFDVVEEAFAKEHDIDYNALLTMYKEEMEQEIKQEKEEEEREKKNDKIRSIVWAIILFVANIVNFFILLNSNWELKDLLLFYSLCINMGLIFLTIHFALKKDGEKGNKLSENGKVSMNYPIIGSIAFFILPILCPLFGVIKDSIGGIGLIIVIGLIGGIPSLLLRGKL